MPQDGTNWRAPYDTFFTRRDDGSVLIFQTNSGKPEDPRRTLEISMSLTELVAITHFFMGQAGQLAQASVYDGEDVSTKPDIQPITNITADALIGGTIDIGFDPESDDPRISAGRMFRADKDKPTEDSPSPQLSGESAIEGGAGDEPADTIAGDTGGDVT